MRTNINTEVNKKPITFSEMGEFVQLYSRLDKPQKEKLSEHWVKVAHDLPITPQKVVNLKKKKKKQ
jgi:hypothetical protein